MEKNQQVVAEGLKAPAGEKVVEPFQQWSEGLL